MAAFKPVGATRQGGVTRLFKCIRSPRTMPAPAACLFDLDGLLLDTEPLHGQAWTRAAAHFGGQLSPSQRRQLRGRRRQDCATQVATWLQAANASPQSATPLNGDDLLAVQQPISRQLLAAAPAMPGAEALVRCCSELAIPMALVTSSAEEAVQRKSAPHPWLEQIQTRVLGDDPELARGKPAADPFRLAAARLGVDPATCWALEDSLAGATAALAAGCRVWILESETEGDGLPVDQLPKGNWTQIQRLDQVQRQLRLLAGA
jgi:pseudouridine-5'-monophosphatase